MNKCGITVEKSHDLPLDIKVTVWLKEYIERKVCDSTLFGINLLLRIVKNSN